MLGRSIIICTFLCIYMHTTVWSAPSDLVATSENPTDATKDAKPAPSDSTTDELPKIYDMRVDTNVSNRFAKTLITSKVKNPSKVAKEATFSVVLPEKAFISEFVMEIEGKSYKAYVKEKEEAKKTYDQAVSMGQAAAHVSVSARDSNRFTVSVHVEPESKATFYLTYEELLQRQLEQYEVVLNIQPGQPVKDLNVQVMINETRPLKFVRSPALRTGNEISKNKKDSLDPNAEIKIIDKTNAVVKFSPDVFKQKEYAKELGTEEKNGLAGQFVVQYDVERDPQGGEVLVNDGYFVHFFAPSDLPALPKYVIFILDTSGSMFGTRITQLKEAMNSILSELKPEDQFNIVEFSSGVKVWDINTVSVGYEEGGDNMYYFGTTERTEKKEEKKELPLAYGADADNIKKAMDVVKQLNANGGTDIMAALKVGIKLIQKNKNEKNQPLIIFLTDGEATVGETDTTKITSTITELNSKLAPIFSLSFGDGADKKFLEKISLKNLGFARHIYEGADASLQLEEFYKQISSPLLSNINFKYVSNVTEVTKTIFPILFHGSEIIVAGRTPMVDPGFDPSSSIEAHGFRGPIILRPKIERPVSSLERLWAYLTLKQILEQRDAAEDKTGPTKEALRVALKYFFVSDVTSLVVVKPNATKAVDTEDASKTNFARPFNGLSVGIRRKTAQARPSLAFAPAAGSPIYPASAYSAVQDRLDVASVRGSSWVPRFGGYGGGPQQQLGFAGPPLQQFLTTPVPFLARPAATIVAEPEIASTTQLSVIDNLKSKLPWLAAILSENGTITTDSGPLDLGISKTVTVTPECPATPKNTTGTCVLLEACPTVYDDLVDLSKFLTHSCKLDKYTGICCPN